MAYVRKLFVFFLFMTLPISNVVGGPKNDVKTDADEHAVFNQEQAQKRRIGRSLTRSLQTAAEGDVQSAVVQAVKSGIDFWLPGLGENAPEWAKRIEFEWDIQEDIDPEFSLLTVQPLFQTEDQQHTLFAQLRAARYKQFGDSRTMTNAGLGYRFLAFDNAVLVGTNAFFDYEWDYNHSRYSVGGELHWSGFDLYANNYWGLSGGHSANAGATEERSTAATSS